MNILDKNQVLIQNFQRFSVNEDKIVAYGIGSVDILATNTNNLWTHIGSDYDNLIGSILSVDVNNQSNLDLDTIHNSLSKKMRNEASWYVKVDISSASDFVQELENKSIVCLQKDSSESSQINYIRTTLIESWLRSPILSFLSDERDSLKKLNSIYNQYPLIKLHFDSYILAILPIYKQVVASQKVSSELAQTRQDNFLFNLEFLKQSSVKNARQNLSNTPSISAEKIDALMNKQLSSLNDLLLILNS